MLLYFVLDVTDCLFKQNERNQILTEISSAHSSRLQHFTYYLFLH